MTSRLRYRFMLWYLLGFGGSGQDTPCVSFNRIALDSTGPGGRQNVHPDLGVGHYSRVPQFRRSIGNLLNILLFLQILSAKCLEMIVLGMCTSIVIRDRYVIFGLHSHKSIYWNRKKKRLFFPSVHL